MGRNLLILGNGFDLDIGLKTSFRAFFESKYWPVSNGSKLSSFLENAKQNGWFSLEDLLTDYASQLPSDYGNKNIEEDKSYYNSLVSGVYEFIVNAAHSVSWNCLGYAYRILKLIETGVKFDVMTFNYTPFEEIASCVTSQRLKIESSLVQYLHGKIDYLNRDASSIILGTTDEKAPHMGRFMLKSHHDSYNLRTLQDKLRQASEIVFFGFSFGKVDGPYFKDFFEELCESRCDNNVKITIFTLNEDSKEDILNNLSDCGISIAKLRGKCHFDIILTDMANYTNPKYFDSFKTFANRLKGNVNNSQVFTTNHNPYNMFDY